MSVKFTRTPMQHYHTCYNNKTYRAVQIAVISDLYNELVANNERVREQLLSEDRPNTIMNLITDVAMEISGVPALSGRLPALLDQIVEHQLSPGTIWRMRQHLNNFEKPGSVSGLDFENAALTSLNISQLQKKTLDLVSTSATLHDSRGRGAHYLLKASASMLEIARLLLLDENCPGYIGEKITGGTNAIDDARREIQNVFKGVG